MAHVSTYAKSVTFHQEQSRKIFESYTKIMKFSKNNLEFSAMDFGCGSGGLLLESLYPNISKNCKELIGTDMDQAMVDYCNTLSVDKVISFEQLDIAGKTIPDRFRERFDVIFSSFCLHFLDFRQPLRNCYDMLSDRGEVLFIFVYPGNPVYRTYKKMSGIEKWKPYMEDFVDYAPHFSGDDRDSELRNLFHTAGFQVEAHEFRTDAYFEATVQQWLDLFHSMDRKCSNIPDEDKEAYGKTFDEICLKENHLNRGNKTLEENLGGYVPIGIVYGKKLV